jgi:hypothetical protein
MSNIKWPTPFYLLILMGRDYFRQSAMLSFANSLWALCAAYYLEVATLASNLRRREQATLCLRAPLFRPYRLSDGTDVEIGRARGNYGAKYEPQRDHWGSEDRFCPIRILTQLHRLSRLDLLRQARRGAGRVNVRQLRRDDDHPGKTLIGAYSQNKRLPAQVQRLPGERCGSGRIRRQHDDAWSVVCRIQTAPPPDPGTGRRSRSGRVGMERKTPFGREPWSSGRFVEQRVSG